MSKRLAIVATHPIQYYAPLFRRLATREDIAIHVFYGWEGSASEATMDPGFGRAIQWDIPLLEGYPFTILTNLSSDPGTHHYRGIISPEFNERLSAWRPDAILVYGWNYHSHLNTLRSFHRRVPVLFRGDSTLIDSRPLAATVARRVLLRWVYRHIDLALYVGVNNRAYYRWCGVRDDRLMWAPHSVDNDRFADPTGELQRAAAAWRAQLGIPPTSATVLFVGKLEPKKAPDVLLRAFIQRNRAEEHLLLVGSGPLESELRVMASDRQNIHFLGFANQSRMPIVYRLGDVFVLPSRGPGETWGLAVNEAMACGKPVIVTDRVGCAPDLVRQGRSGEVVPADDTGALQSAIGRLLDHPERRLQLAAGSARLIQEWSMDAQASHIVDAVRIVTGTR